jgi:hypothetical protein
MHAHLAVCLDSNGPQRRARALRRGRPSLTAAETRQANDAAGCLQTAPPHDRAPGACVQPFAAPCSTQCLPRCASFDVNGHSILCWRMEAFALEGLCSRSSHCPRRCHTDCAVIRRASPTDKTTPTAPRNTAPCPGSACTCTARCPAGSRQSCCRQRAQSRMWPAAWAGTSAPLRAAAPAPSSACLAAQHEHAVVAGRPPKRLVYGRHANAFRSICV